MRAILQGAVLLLGVLEEPEEGTGTAWLNQLL